MQMNNNTVPIFYNKQIDKLVKTMNDFLFKKNNDYDLINSFDERSLVFSMYGSYEYQQLFQQKINNIIVSNGYA